MKFKALKSALVLAALAVAGSAQAAIDSPNSDVNNTGGSELVFTAVSTTGETYTRDLGIGFGDITNTSNYSFAADADLTSILGTLDYWWIGALDLTQGGAGADASTYGRRVQLTSTDGNPVMNTAAMLNGVANNYGPEFGLLNSTAGHDAPGDNTSFPTDTVDFLGGATGISGTNSIVGGLGDSLAYFTYTETGTVTSTIFGSTFNVDGISIEYLGDWTLAANGTLNFGVIPVPAAVWLFGSALLGLVGIGRRK